MIRQLRMAIMAMLVICVALANVAPATAGQIESDEQGATRALVDVLRLEGARDVNRLYDRLIPDERDVLSRQAFANWFEMSKQPVPIGEPQIGRITAGDWTSELTGIRYRNVVFVEYSVDVGSEQKSQMRSGEMTLLNDGQGWRWLFDGGQEDIFTIASADTWSVVYESPYRTEMFRNIDTFWAQVFANAGLEYRPPVDIVGINVEPTQTGCGPESNIEEIAVYYCMNDQTIYYDPGFRDLLVDQIGEYAWEHVVAHEWAHHIQNLLGISTSPEPELLGGLYTIEHELQADCLSGVFEQDAFARDILGQEELDMSIAVTNSAGDARGTSWDDDSAHGTGAQREQSYWLGFDDGFVGCRVSLNVVD